MSFVFPARPPISWPIVGKKSRFPVRRIYCVGKNYAEHVVEMGGDLTTSKPVIFTKDATTLVKNWETIPYPPFTTNLHHEIELVVAMGRDGVFGYAVGLDMTRRDIQAEAKAGGKPWDRSKNFIHSAPCTAITPANQLDISTAQIELRVNGALKQSSSLDKMIWSIPTIIEFLQQDMDLQAGDLIFTGTPQGVGPVGPGDQLIGKIDGLETLDINYV